MNSRRRIPVMLGIDRNQRRATQVQTNQTITPSNTQGRSARNTTTATNTINRLIVPRLTSALLSSVMYFQRGISGTASMQQQQ